VTLREGQNREIRRLFARVGARVRRLERIALGPLQLGGLPSGRYRRLRAPEIEALYRSAGLWQAAPPAPGR
jgi:16S rRNA U516 pseudouridylate synthase RsuA-like enzyme